MKILIFTEGTIIQHKGAIGHTREEIVQQVKDKETSIYNFVSYVPIGNASPKINNWKKNGAEIVYLTSRTINKEVKLIKNVLKKYQFPQGKLLFRQKGEKYHHIAEIITPDILIEDDCESIGGVKEMTITHVEPNIKAKIKSIIVKEFAGIDHLPDKVNDLNEYQTTSP